MDLPIDAWINAAAHLIGAVIAESGFLVYALIFAVILTLMLVFVQLGTSYKR